MAVVGARLFRVLGRFSGPTSPWTACSRHLPWVEASVRPITVAAARKTSDKVTHTGQQWEETDYRNIRFTDREKMVNEKFAIDLVAEEPAVVIKGNHVWCDGGRGALGHPKVYINLDKPEINVCGYCGKRFVAETHKEHFKDENLAYGQQ